MKVKKVKFINDKVEIVLEEKSFFISKENYIENPLAVDSYVSEDRINFLLEQERVIESKIELIKLLNRKILTEYEIIRKLKEKSLKNEDILEITNSLKRMGLINDEYVGILVIENLILKRKGRLEIKKVLKEKGLNYETIDKLVDGIDEEVYKNNFKKVCEKYLKMYSSKSSKMKEQMTINKLQEYGYEEEYIKTLKISKNNDEEMILVKQSLNKLLKNKKTDLNNYENLNKIKSKLVMKGFSYDIINLALEEVVNDETY